MATKKKSEKTAFDELVDTLNNKPWLSTDFKEVKNIVRELRRKDNSQRALILTSFDTLTAEIMVLRERVEELEGCLAESQKFIPYKLDIRRKIESLINKSK